MNTQQIKEQLCYYDKRNPLGVYRETDEPHNTDDCYCDNCFRGKHDLANELLRVKEKLQIAQSLVSFK